MKMTTNRLLPVLLAGIIMSSGCAKQLAVKTDETPFPSAAKATESAPYKPAAPVAKTQDKPDAASTMESSSGGDLAKAQQVTETNLTADMGKETDLKNVLEQIYFDFDASTLSDAARETLARNYGVLKQRRLPKIRIEGHCDERGSDEYNLALGERRAQTASRYLVSLGVPANRMSVISYGKEKPADRGHDEAAWAKNRRDEFVIVK